MRIANGLNMLTSHPCARLVWLCVLGSGCGHTSAAQKPVEPAPAPVEAAPPPPAEAPAAPAAETKDAPLPGLHGDAYVRALMNDHFIITKLARDAVIAGDIEAARGPVAALADYEYASELPAGWRPHLDRLQDAARQTVSAGDLTGAARGVATMAKVCGDCHLEESGKAELGASSEPITGRSDSLHERMGRHILALDRMWVGLTGPSDDAWRDGAKVLLHAPAKMRGTSTELSADFQASLREVRALGRSAEAAKSGEQRAEVYGQLLATCAHCHALHAAVDF
jgi:hypothetical protein